jgi:hypothetical protein
MHPGCPQQQARSDSIEGAHARERSDLISGTPMYECIARFRRRSSDAVWTSFAAWPDWEEQDLHVQLHTLDNVQ